MTRGGRGIYALDWPKAAPVRRAIESVFGLSRLERMQATLPEGVTGEAFLVWLLRLLGVELSVGPADLSRVPKSPFVKFFTSTPGFRFGRIAMKL